MTIFFYFSWFWIIFQFFQMTFVFSLFTCIWTQFLKMRLFFILLACIWTHFLQMRFFQFTHFNWDFCMHFNDLRFVFVFCYEILTILWNKTRLCVLQIPFHFYFSFKRSGLIWSDFTKTKHSRLFFVSL